MDESAAIEAATNYAAKRGVILDRVETITPPDDTSGSYSFCMIEKGAAFDGRHSFEVSGKTLRVKWTSTPWWMNTILRICHLVKSYKKAICVAAACMIFVYTASYLALSLNGHYRPLFFGLIQGPNDTAVLAPKFGYDWMLPGMDDYESGQISMVEILYSPLLFLDRSIWHTRSRARSMDYPIRNYFDRGTFQYRNHDPD